MNSADLGLCGMEVPNFRYIQFDIGFDLLDSGLSLKEAPNSKILLLTD